MPDTAIKPLRLSDMKTGTLCVITKVLGYGGFRKRIIEIGFVKGKTVKVIKNAPMQYPIEYEILGYHVSLRRSEAELIEVVPITENMTVTSGSYQGTFFDKTTDTIIQEKSKIINVALVGNPNSGKTTLFNSASGAHERVGNYAGVTVDLKTATLKQKGYTIHITDLPGTYSISGYTPEEMYVQQHLMDAMPDVVINVVDASNLDRNLFLTTQLIDANIKVIIALNMYDELENSGAIFAYEDLSMMIGIPMVPMVAKKGKGIKELFDEVIAVFEDHDPVVRHIHINYGEDIERAISQIQCELWKNKELPNRFSTRFFAIKLLENEKAVQKWIDGLSNKDEICTEVEVQIKHLEKKYDEAVETILTDAKYGFIAGALSETYQPGKQGKQKLSTAIDTIITHKYLGIPVLVLFLWIMFQTTFTLGQYPMDWLESGFAWLAGCLNGLLPDGSIKDLLVDGVIGGLGGVMVFLPNILILFFFISLMEDTGYMARAAFIMDRLMHKIGLHGKSFIPLLMGFGCNVPAVMATRTLESRKDRLLTMLITPFMSCSARLPVYVLLISIFFSKNQGIVLFSIYLTGILLAALSALLLKKTVFLKEEAPFVMELPPYRIPTLKNTLRHMWNKAVRYLQKMGKVILFASILIWVLSYYPRNTKLQEHYDMQIAQVEDNDKLHEEEKHGQVYKLEIQKASELQEASLLGQLGHFIEPVVRPLGFDWKMGVSILTGLAAKEIVVSSMGILYQADMDADENSANLKEKIQQQTYTSGPKTGQKVFTPLVAYSFMLFILVYFPCIAVVAAIRKEGGWKWAVFSMVYNTAVAWILSFLVYQAGSLF
jgi:ferrous iron transport protein B